MKKNWFPALLLMLFITFSTLSGCGGAGDKGGSGDKISATIILVLEDESEVTYELNVSSGLSLRDALYEAGLITEETYGAMFVENIDGHIADTLNDGVTWLPCDTQGNQIMGSFDEITLEDGQTMYLKYYVVPQMD